MPIDLYCTLKKTSQWAFGSSFLNSVLGSSIFVSIVVSLVMVLIVMIMYPAKAGTSFSVVAKMFVYMFLGTMVVVFLHDGVIKYMLEEEHAADKSEEFMQNTTIGGREYDPAYSNMYKPIVPNAPKLNDGQYANRQDSRQDNRQDPYYRPDNLKTDDSDSDSDSDAGVLIKSSDSNYQSPFDELRHSGKLEGPKPSKAGGNPYQ
jgi:hypothetical protein